MGKSSPAPPTPPSAAATAAAQGTSNIDTAAAQAALNNVNQVTPYGSSTFNQTGNYTSPVTGTQLPTYTQTTTLNPAEQNVLTQQQSLAQQLAGYGTSIGNSAGSAITTPLNFSNLPAQPTSLGTLPSLPQASDYTANMDQATQNAFNSEMGLIQPQEQYAQRQLTSSLNNAGIPLSSQAYGDAQNLLANQQALQNNSLAAGAEQQGIAEQAQQYGQAATTQSQAAQIAQENAALQAAARGQGITEQQLSQTQPINELSALLQGAPAITQPNVMSPSQTGVSPTDVVGATAAQTAAQNAQYQAQVAQASSGNNAMAGLGGAAITGAAILF